jgi:hypothetical protein
MAAPDTLTSVEREWLASVRSVGGLQDLRALLDVEGAHDAYFAAKDGWRRLRGAELSADPDAVDEEGVPGARVLLGDTTYHVHGVTHADTDAERWFLREHAPSWVEEGAAVYCEQGIRRMYFADVGGVCAMDDYRWAMERCRALDIESNVDGFPSTTVDAIVEDVSSLAAQFRETAFSLIEENRDVYGEAFAAALGDVAAGFLMSHENVATAQDYDSFALSTRAAENPGRLAELQRYYERAFLPQPIEREWLRRHDPEMELVTHARNARMADYAVYHSDLATDVHLVVGAAHQPGIRYYLERHRDGNRALDGFEPV